jgi:hypothetical protein
MVAASDGDGDGLTRACRRFGARANQKWRV